MYQLYAYGKKYALNSQTPISPKLVLVYPKSDKFSETLDDFIYEGDLVLKIVPFDMQCALNSEKEKEEVMGIMEKAHLNIWNPNNNSMYMFLKKQIVINLYFIWGFLILEIKKLRLLSANFLIKNWFFYL